MSMFFFKCRPKQRRACQKCQHKVIKLCNLFIWCWEDIENNQDGSYHSTSSRRSIQIDKFANVPMIDKARISWHRKKLYSGHIQNGTYHITIKQLLPIIFGKGVCYYNTLLINIMQYTRWTIWKVYQWMTMYKRNHWTEAESWHISSLKHGILQSV